MTKRSPVLFRNYFGQIKFQLYRIGVFRKSQSPRQANNVRVTGYSGNAESVAEDAVGRFTSHAGKGQKLVHRTGNLAAVLLVNSCTRLLNVDSFVVEKTRAANVFFYLFQICTCPVGGGFVFLEQVLRYYVDTGIRSLSRKNCRYQQFQRIDETKSDFRIRIRLY